MPCDHEKMFPSFCWGCTSLFFAYIRNVVGGCAFFSYCDVFVIMPCDHVKKFPSFYHGDREHATLFCLHKGYCVCVAVAALFSIVIYLSL